MQIKALVKEILMKENITTWYQPIINTQGNRLLGWEGLTRGPSVTPLHSAAALFRAAHEAGKLKPVELMCLKNAAISFEQLQLPGKLFVNVSHELFLAGNHLRNQLTELAKASPISANRVVVELTGQSATSDVEKLVEAANFFRSLGVEIAIDDLGVGKISHSDWMKLEPEYVKVSRQFINNIEKDPEKIEIVKSIVSAAHSAHSKVIALGVETQEELDQVKELGISICEGYLFQRPQLSPDPATLENMNVDTEAGPEKILACDLIENRQAVELSVSLSELQRRFNEDMPCNALTVLKEGSPLGLLKRSAFLTCINNSEFPDGAELALIEGCIDQDVLLVDANTELRSLARQLVKRPQSKVYDDFIVMDKSQLLGMGTVIEVMRQLVSYKDK